MLFVAEVFNLGKGEVREYWHWDATFTWQTEEFLSVGRRRLCDSVPTAVLGLLKLNLMHLSFLESH